MKCLPLLFCLLVLWGCEKKVDFDLKNSDPKLVVEATIENGTAPVVLLSKSQNYFSKITADELAASFVRGAKVEITDGTKTETLKEYSAPLGGGYRLYYYTTDTANRNALIGKLATKYTLNITAEGKTYTATTTIPNITKKIDSIWWKEVKNDTSGKQATVAIRVTDPKGFGDYIRYWTKRNREPFLPGFNSAYDDLIIDGTTYDLDIEPGADRNDVKTFDERSFKRGDTVTLKLSNIDKATFDFWRTMEYTYASVGNPFSSPTRVINNISNGALGYFGGYASQFRTIIIPR